MLKIRGNGYKVIYGDDFFEAKNLAKSLFKVNFSNKSSRNRSRDILY